MHFQNVTYDYILRFENLLEEERYFLESVRLDRKLRASLRERANANGNQISQAKTMHTVLFWLYFYAFR